MQRFSIHFVKWPVTFILLLCMGLLLFFSHHQHLQTAADVADHLETQHQLLETLVVHTYEDETTARLKNHLVQVNRQTYRGYRIFMEKMRDVARTVEQSETLDIITHSRYYRRGTIRGTPYEHLPRANKRRINDQLIPFFTNVASGTEEVQRVYIGTPRQEFYLGPLDDVDRRTYDVTAEPWYQQAIESPDRYIWTAPRLDDETGVPVMSLVKAVSRNDQLIGVLGVDFALTPVASLVEEMGGPENGYTFLLDATDRVLARSKAAALSEETVQQALRSSSTAEQEDFLEWDEDGTTMLGHVLTDPDTGFRLVTVVPGPDLSRWQATAQQMSEKRQALMSTLHEQHTGTFYAWAIAGTVLIIIVFLTLHMHARRITRSLGNIGAVIAAWTKGDWSQPIERTNTSKEIQHLQNSLNDMSDEIRQLVASHRRLVRHMAEASCNLAAASRASDTGLDQLAQSVDAIQQDMAEQAHQLDQMERIADDVTNELKALQAAWDAMHQTVRRPAVTNGQSADALRDLEATAVQHAENFQHMSESITALAQQVESIRRLTTKIKDIADQTHMLALNAAIEAARAGEDGRGFSIVAQEVRKLADQSAQTAKEIEQLIGATHEYVQQSVQHLKRSAQTARQQMSIVQQTQRHAEAQRAVIARLGQQLEPILERFDALRQKSRHWRDALGLHRRLNRQAAEQANALQTALNEQVAACREIITAMEQLSATAQLFHQDVARFHTDESEK